MSKGGQRPPGPVTTTEVKSLERKNHRKEMKVSVPKGLSGKDLYNYLIENKALLLKQKKSLIIFTEPFTSSAEVNPVVAKAPGTAKAADGSVVDNATVVDGEKLITAIANTMNWCDVQNDVMGVDSFKKTIKESGPQGKDRVQHLKDHDQCTDGVVGYIQQLYLKDIDLATLGIGDAYHKTQCLLMQSLVKDDLDHKVFVLYSDKRIDQHSVGIQYVKIELCINDSDYKDEFAAWNKYYSVVINQDYVNQYGFFWYVSEVKLFEISTVLFGANEVTPTLEDDDQPEYSTDKSKQPPASTEEKFDSLDFIKKKERIIQP